MPPFSLRPHERLRHPKDFLRVRKYSTRYRALHFRVNCAPNGLTAHRLGMVVAKRFWKAVLRNRIKRRIREFFRLHKHLIAPPPSDIVIIAMPGAEQIGTKEVAIEILAALEKEGKQAP
jgi:ribonuclease P protein component